MNIYDDHTGYPGFHKHRPSLLIVCAGDPFFKMLTILVVAL